jgi:hypothetical protein
MASDYFLSASRWRAASSSVFGFFINLITIYPVSRHGPVYGGQ